MVCGRSAGVLRPKLHLTHDSTRRAGPPVSASSRSHCRPILGLGGSAKPMTSPARTTIGTRSCKAMRKVMAACSAPTVVCSMTAGSLPVDFDQPLAMETAVSSWRTETYSGISPGAHGLASASHSGAQSEPGEAKMRSTPMLRSALSRDSAPVMRLFLAQAELGKELAVALAFAAHVGCELLRRHRLGGGAPQRAGR